jgi:predicted  nucleic acid-binding Zn-ribbon protein
VTRVSNLFRLQTLDSQIDAYQARLAEIAADMERHPEQDRARAEEESARSALESSRQTLRRAEEETRTQQRKISETESTLYGGGVRNPKELQDLQEESASLRRYLSVLEDRQLQAMMQSEEAEKILADAKVRREEQERSRAEAEAKFRSERDALQAALVTLDVQHEAAVSPIAAEDLEKYSALRKSKRGLAVVHMEGGACTGCGVAASAARIDSARSGQEIIPCGNCGRILYLG